MTQSELARSYLEKAFKRRRVLEVLMEEQAYSDVIRESQELVELALKGMLRSVGIDPPKWHDVGPILQERQELFPNTIRGDYLNWRRYPGGYARNGNLPFTGTSTLFPPRNIRVPTRTVQSRTHFLSFTARNG